MIPQSPIRKIMEMAEPKNIINMGLNPDEVIPFAGGWVNHYAPDRLREEYISIAKDKELFHKASGYSPTSGLLKLRRLLVALSKEIYNIGGIKEDNILIGQSSSQLLFSILLALSKEKDKVLVFDPTYANYFEQINISGRTVITVSVLNEKSWSYKKSGEILKNLKQVILKKKPKIIILCSPDNPTGQILPDPVVEKIIEEADKINCRVAIDEAYRDFYYTDETPKHFSYGPIEFKNLIKIYSSSKWCRGLGRRLGWMLADISIIEKVENLQKAMILCPDTLHQTAMLNYLEKSLKDGSLRRYLKDTREKYAKAAQFTEHCIKKYLKKRFLRVNGGLYTVVDIGTESEKFCYDILKNTGVVFVPGTGFGKTLDKAIRVSFGPLVNDLKKIEDGFCKVAKYLFEK